MIMILMKD